MMGYVSHADLGGRGDVGPVAPHAEEDALFHAAWESRVLAITLAMGAAGGWNIDMSRSARETLPNYRDLSYYEIWLGALEKLLVAKGLVSTDELSAGRPRYPSTTVNRAVRADQVAAILAKGLPTERTPTSPARYAPGQRVRTRSTPAEHHTRLPGYLRGKTGVIERVLGVHVFADSHAQGLGEDPQWLYTVVFDAVEVWGTKARPGDRVSFDAWQPYLKAA